MLFIMLTAYHGSEIVAVNPDHIAALVPVSKKEGWARTHTEIQLAGGNVLRVNEPVTTILQAIATSNRTARSAA